ncbi:MAG TPA: histidine kinase, partial [Acetobacteraceae bacterium]
MIHRLLSLNTVRGRLLVAAICVETFMLTLMVGNGTRLLYSSLADQVKTYAAQISPVLNAALVAPLAQRDYATVQAILTESKAADGLTYLAVLDAGGKLIAASGWPRDRALPAPDAAFSLVAKDGTYRYDVERPILMAGQPLGSLRFGLSL